MLSGLNVRSLLWVFAVFSVVSVVRAQDASELRKIWGRKYGTDGRFPYF
jgi:hypothetical protein